MGYIYIYIYIYNILYSFAKDRITAQNDNNKKEICFIEKYDNKMWIFSSLYENWITF